MTRGRPRPATNASLAHDGARAFTQKSTTRELRVGLCLAVGVHLLLLVAVTVDSHSPRSRVGERDALPNAINVDIVDASELEQGGVAQPNESQPSRVTKADDKPPAKATEQPRQGLEDIDGPPQNRTAKPMSKSVTDATTAKKKQKFNASADQLGNLGLDLTMPAMPSTSGVTRPAGITRSGENDEFGRGVIRALRQSMPAANGAIGRVTVRIFLSEVGNLSDVQLVQSSGNSALDQQVVFAVRMSSFPIPPTASSLADRTFLVSYLYR
jgi:TonB family protein